MAPQDESGDGYTNAWGAIGAALEDGTSWSGHERSRAWRNSVDGFIDSSAIWGLDHVEDGRVALQVDWDGDGDLDLWLRFRNGPTLRFMENRSERPGWLLEVPAAESRTAVRSLRAELLVGGACLWNSRPVVAAAARPVSDGYLGAVDRGVRLALPLTERKLLGLDVELRDGDVAKAVVEESARNSSRALLVREDGMWRVKANEESGPDLGALGAGPLATAPLPTRVVLRTPLGLPSARARALGDLAGGRLLVVRSIGCAVCEASVPPFLEALAERGDAAAATVVVLEDQDDARTGDFALSVAESILGPGADVALPVGLLLDRAGALQVVYTGALDDETVARDTRDFARGAVRGAERTGVGRPGGARWFHGAPREYGPLIRALRASGLESDADLYTRSRDGR